MCPGASAKRKTDRALLGCPQSKAENEGWLCGVLAPRAGRSIAKPILHAGKQVVNLGTGGATVRRLATASKASGIHC